MKKLIFILFFALTATFTFSQSAIIGGAGVCFTNAAPSSVSSISKPGNGSTCRIAVDTVNAKVYWYGDVGTGWQEFGAGGGGMSSFSLAGNTGTSQTISDGNSLWVKGYKAITTNAKATDSLVVSLTLDEATNGVNLSQTASGLKVDLVPDELSSIATVGVSNVTYIWDGSLKKVRMDSLMRVRFTGDSGGHNVYNRGNFKFEGGSAISTTVSSGKVVTAVNLTGLSSVYAPVDTSSTMLIYTGGSNKKVSVGSLLSGAGKNIMNSSLTQTGATTQTLVSGSNSALKFKTSSKDLMHFYTQSGSESVVMDIWFVAAEDAHLQKNVTIAQADSTKSFTAHTRYNSFKNMPYYANNAAALSAFSNVTGILYAASAANTMGVPKGTIMITYTP